MWVLTSVIVSIPVIWGKTPCSDILEELVACMILVPSLLTGGWEQYVAVKYWQWSTREHPKAIIFTVIVGTVTGYGLVDRGIRIRIPVGSSILTSPYHPDWYWSHPSSYPMDNGGGSFRLGRLKRQGHEANHSWGQGNVDLYIHSPVESRTHTECSRWPWEVRRCFGRDEEQDVITRTRTECPRWPREGQSLLWTEWRARCLYWAVSGSVRPNGRDATRAPCSQRASW
jgi:hypothetical protein